jgi:hypothetical protein
VHWWVRRIWISGGIVFFAALVWNVQAHGVDAALLESSERVEVARADRSLAFLPVVPPDAAVPLVLFLPGGLIQPKAYVPLARSLADEGMATVIVPLPWRSAPTASTRAELWSRIEAAAARWGRGEPFVLAGHSRGAALAARYAAERSPAGGPALSGLVLIGTTHPRDHDLSGASFPILKLLGSRDCVAPTADARANADRLPPHTEWREIAGANHRQFGYYGWQLGDCDATISRDDQQRQVRDAIAAFVRGQEAGRLGGAPTGEPGDRRSGP